MFDQSAEIYDLLYANIRDRSAEAAHILAVVQARCPHAKSLLDVACGTGIRAETLRRQSSLTVDGLDIEPGMVALARSRNPGAHFVQADMVSFDLSRTYDVVVSLFSSIGYVRTLDRLRTAISAMGRHVAPGGILVVEPWFPPGALEDGYVTVTTGERDGVWACRMSHARVKDRLSEIHFEYLIGSRDGLRRASEVHRMGLFTHEEMLAAFSAAGFAVDFDPVGIAGRGLYVASAAV